MSDVVLSTLNARWTHASLGLRYLFANLGPLRDRATILEFEIGGATDDVVANVLRRKPKIAAFGVYVWNARETAEVIGALKSVAPDLIVVVGGPEVSYETETSEVARRADHVVRGEADLAFRRLCEDLLEGRGAPRVIDAPLPDLKDVASPYAYYDAIDVARRTLYVEASRGCPYACEFCLSALDVPVRQFPLERFLSDLDALYVRGARRFKFVDRTFNLNVGFATAILKFFLDRGPEDLFLHFETVPDRFPDALRAVVASFPNGSLQFEVGVQTLDDATSERIARRQDVAKLEDNLAYLRTNTGVHLHVDLIVGLPGETVESFARGFDRLVALKPHEIQVGVLKRLKGAPLRRHDAIMAYAPDPPYEILKTDVLDFETTLALKRFAKAWDLVANGGNFERATERLLGDAPFRNFFLFSEDLFRRAGAQAAIHGIALTRLLGFVFDHLVARGDDPREVAETLLSDYVRGGRSDVPPVLRPFVEPRKGRTTTTKTEPRGRPGLERQDRRRG